MKRTMITALLASAAWSGAAMAQEEIRVLRVQPSDPEQAFYERVEAAYEAQNPDIDVVFEYIAN